MTYQPYKNDFEQQDADLADDELRAIENCKLELMAVFASITNRFGTLRNTKAICDAMDMCEEQFDDLLCDAWDKNREHSSIDWTIRIPSFDELKAKHFKLSAPTVLKRVPNQAMNGFRVSASMHDESEGV